MVKPYLVEKIKEYNTTIDSNTTTVLNEHICSDKTIQQLRKMLEGVVENGTAMNLKTEYLKVAGKTGTAVIAHGNQGYGNKIYQASFCGYFPAEEPLYSMIVVINSPGTNGYYGNVVAGSVFKEVADKVYSLNLDIHQPINIQANAPDNLPVIQKASISNLKSIYGYLGVKLNDVDGEWATASTGTGKLSLSEKEFANGIVPDVKGMTLKDAIYLLEGLGMKVAIAGKGTVVRQSVPAGTRFTRGTQILIELT
jgi:cell division protein FtsI (penicillin-binding protein 3)